MAYVLPTDSGSQKHFMPTRHLRASALALSAGLTASPAVSALVFRVDTVIDQVDAAPGEGACHTVEGHCTLRAAIQEANASSGFDTVLIPIDTYFLDTVGHAGEDDAARGDLDITDAVELRGVPGGVPNLSAAVITNRFVFDADADRLVDIRAGSPWQPVRFDRVDFSFGHTAEPLGGGGVLVRAGSFAEFSNCAIYANTTTGAPGVALANYGTTMMRRCVVSDNRSTPGASVVRGTLYSSGNSRTELDEVEVNSNFVQAGGAIAADGQAMVRIARSHFIGNFASGGTTDMEGGSGGAVWLRGSARAEISNTTLVTNMDASSLPSRNSIVVRDQATLVLHHVSLFDFSIEAPVAELPQVSLEASVVYDTADGLAEHDLTRTAACLGGVSSRGNNRIAASRACSIDLIGSDGRPPTLRAQGVAYPAVHPNFSLQRVLVLALPSDVLDLPADAPCPTTDQLGAARPTARSPGMPPTLRRGRDRAAAGSSVRGRHGDRRGLKCH